MTKQLVLLLGGARSGKSSYAEKLAVQIGPRALYVATAEAKDEEMRARIAVHQRLRPPTWTTVEAASSVANTIRAALEPAGSMLSYLTASPCLCRIPS